MKAFRKSLLCCPALTPVNGFSLTSRQRIAFRHIVRAAMTRRETVGIASFSWSTSHARQQSALGAVMSRTRQLTPKNVSRFRRTLPYEIRVDGLPGSDAKNCSIKAAIIPSRTKGGGTRDKRPRRCGRLVAPPGLVYNFLDKQWAHFNGALLVKGWCSRDAPYGNLAAVRGADKREQQNEWIARAVRPESAVFLAESDYERPICDAAQW